MYTTLLCVSFSNDRAMECREVCDLELLLVPVSRWKRRPLHVMSQSTIIMATSNVDIVEHAHTWIQ